MSNHFLHLPILRRGDHRTTEAVVVIGLGRFGGAIARQLEGNLHHDVLGIDRDPETVQRFADELRHVAEADSTDPVALRQLGVPDFHTAVVAIGDDVEASVLTAAALVDLGVPNIWAKALNEAHGHILHRILEGAPSHHVVYPEREMGERVAHQVTGGVLDYFQLDEDGEGDDLTFIETLAPADSFGKSLTETDLRRRFGVTIVAVKNPGERFTYATPETVLSERTKIVAVGDARSIDKFTAHCETVTR